MKVVDFSSWGCLTSANSQFSELNDTACDLDHSSSVPCLTATHIEFTTALRAKLSAGGAWWAPYYVTLWVTISNFTIGGLDSKDSDLAWRNHALVIPQAMHELGAN